MRRLFQQRTWCLSSASLRVKIVLWLWTAVSTIFICKLSNDAHLWLIVFLSRSDQAVIVILNAVVDPSCSVFFPSWGCVRKEMRCRMHQRGKAVKYRWWFLCGRRQTPVECLCIETKYLFGDWMLSAAWMTCHLCIYGDKIFFLEADRYLNRSSFSICLCSMFI